MVSWNRRIKLYKKLLEIARSMMHRSKVPQHFWDKVINTACYVMNKVLLRPFTNKMSYELYKSKKPNVSYFHIFECPCDILKHAKDTYGKFDSKGDESIFLDYSTSSKAYRVYNYRTLRVEESIIVKFNETNNSSRRRMSLILIQLRKITRMKVLNLEKVLVKC